jgi:hypothetical protein
MGLVLGALGPCPQVGARLFALAGGLGAELADHALRVGPGPLGLGAGCCLRCLRPGGLLLRLPGRRPGAPAAGLGKKMSRPTAKTLLGAGIAVTACVAFGVFLIAWGTTSPRRTGPTAALPGVSGASSSS